MSKSIGLDLDGVLVGLPPLVPSWIVERLYKDQNSTTISYRFPGKLEQYIRRLSHLPFVRPAIEPNCTLVRQFAEKNDLFLISGRYSFLEQVTVDWLKKYKLFSSFKTIYLNLNNEQPHIFKSMLLEKLKLSSYIDDDFDSIMYCAPRYRKTHFYWYTNTNTVKLNHSNITGISDLKKVLS